ncbi:MAG: HNH endonuclease [Polyangiaceae bacterium]|nr:HNH endonuclease [Polyangiaceae bacterium]
MATGSASRAPNARSASGSAPSATPSSSPRSRSRTSPAHSASTARPWRRRCPRAPSAAAPSPTSSLHRLRRAFQLSRRSPMSSSSLREAGRHDAEATEAERLVVQRVGQDLFRHGLLEYWEARCAITGLAVPELLRASHIKPWVDCSSDAERLDIWNGLLLAPHLDAAFDRGFITVADDGAVLVSAALDAAARAALGLDEPLRVRALHDGHRAYLPWHRDRVFKVSGPLPANVDSSSP